MSSGRRYGLIEFFRYGKTFGNLALLNSPVSVSGRIFLPLAAISKTVVIWPGKHECRYNPHLPWVRPLQRPEEVAFQLRWHFKGTGGRIRPASWTDLICISRTS